MTDITKASQSCVVPIDETQAARTQKAVQNLKIERLSMGGSESSFEHCLSTSTCSSLKRERMNRLLGLFIAHLTVGGEGGTSVVVALYVHMSGRLRSMASFDSWESRGAENAIGGESSSAPAPSPLRLPDLQGVLAFAVPAIYVQQPPGLPPPLSDRPAHTSDTDLSFQIQLNTDVSSW